MNCGAGRGDRDGRNGGTTQETPVAIVTGAGRGIGQAIAVRLAEEGYHVLASDRTGAMAEETARRIGAGRATACQLDVADRDGVHALVEKMSRTHVRVDLLVNNAMWMRYAPHSAVKGAVASLTRQLAGDLGPRGIRVNAIAPGTIETEGQSATMSAEAIAYRIQRSPLGKLGVPDDVGGAVAFLGGRASQFITGQVMTVDGGITAVM